MKTEFVTFLCCGIVKTTLNYYEIANDYNDF